MVKIDYGNANPQKGIFGCAHAANEYLTAKGKLPKIDKAIDSLVNAIDRLLMEASGMYYTSAYGPSELFEDSATKSIERLELIRKRMDRFINDIRENFLKERSKTLKDPISFFLSYSSKDKSFASQFAKDLRDQAHKVWIDEEDIKLGETIRRSIEKGIENTHFLIFLVSKSSIASEWCQRELDIALQKETESNTVVLPLLLESCKIPSILKTKKYLVIKNDGRDVERFLTLVPDKERNK